MEAKRQRASNFTADERVALLNIVKNYKHILENKKTDAITWREKEGIWLRIEKEFNATSPACINRSQEQLRKCYENQKKIVRKIAANNRLNLCKTGGGPSSCNDSNNPTYDLTMSILSQKSVLGLNDRFGGDREESRKTNAPLLSNDEIVEFEEVEDYEMEQIILKVVNDEDDANTIKSPQSGETFNKKKGLIEKEENIVWQHYKPSDLRTPLHKTLKNVVGKPAAVSNKAEASTAENAWSSRRRPATSANIMLARKFEDLVDTKQEIANIQLEVLKKERDDIIERGFREKEEFLIKKNQMLEIHEIQKQLLLLDVEVKKAQLDKLQTM
ncbi:hypothetical protein MML48_4g00008079 [Holotrichia oblita]|uniref:Uncharacterized protein n=1 Tax=Holotrichia oblita TaxID=644536 RepID=A0ACB9T8N6_HOLOL|nr:hypothetical protein MML48_4g00008079 [Holotrichia oblita]